MVSKELRSHPLPRLMSSPPGGIFYLFFACCFYCCFCVCEENILPTTILYSRPTTCNPPSVRERTRQATGAGTESRWKADGSTTPSFGAEPFVQRLGFGLGAESSELRGSHPPTLLFHAYLGSWVTAFPSWSLEVPS